MATNPRKRQQKLERRAAKRKDKRHDLIKGQNVGLAERLAAADHYPILHARIAETLWTQGLGWALLSRELPTGSVAFALFLVDRYCLGVKNAMADIVSRFTYESRVLHKMKSEWRTRDAAPATVRQLVEESVGYAHDLGFSPHPDYHKAMRLFGAVNPAESLEKFEFGKDGKPYFISGPNETAQRCRQIMDALQRKCGPDGFHCLLPLGEHFNPLPDGFHRERGRVIAPEQIGGYRVLPVDLGDTDG
jgi:hypothetical protein